MEHTAETLKAIRLELGLTQEEMGERLGVSKTQVYRMESERQPVSPTISRLLDYIAGRGPKRRRKA